MARRLLLAALTAQLTFTCCSPEKFRATIPAYISVPGVELRTDYDKEGTAHSKITTVWIHSNDEFIGTYELPCTVPVLQEGKSNIKIQTGITMNGVSSSRALYPYYQPLDTSVNLTPGDTFEFVRNPDHSLPVVKYEDFARIIHLENFDGSGLDLSSTPRSDTNIYKSSDSAHIFINTDVPENNGNVGVVTLDASHEEVELATVTSYKLPTTGESVYLELTYRNDIPFSLGVVANSGAVSTYIPTLLIYESETFNKIYINLVNEITYIQDASSFGIFIYSKLPAGRSSGNIFLDNMKLVY